MVVADEDDKLYNIYLILGLTKCTIYNVQKMFPLLLLCSFFRLKELISKKWFNYIITFFFLKKLPKNWVGRNKGVGLKLKRREMNSRIHTGWAAD